MKQLIGVVIVIENEGRILLGKRKNSYKQGSYGLPGGRIELGELMLDALEREVLEETGLLDCEFSYLGAVREFQETRDFIHFVFECELPEGQEPKNTEPDKCEGWEWFEPENIPEQTVEGHAAGVELYLSRGEKKLVDLFK